MLLDKAAKLVTVYILYVYMCNADVYNCTIIIAKPAHIFKQTLSAVCSLKNPSYLYRRLTSIIYIKNKV